MQHDCRLEPACTDAPSGRPSAGRFPPPRRWRLGLARLMLLAGGVAAITLFAGRAVAQDATPGTTDAAGTTQVADVPNSAWLLPFDSLADLEPVTWAIVIASVVAVTLIIQAFLRVRRDVILPQESTQQIEQFIQQRQFRELVEFTASDDSFVSRTLSPALKRAPNYLEMREALETGVAEETAEQFRRLEYINLIANIGPLLGLLGTVVGIMDAFLAMYRAEGAAEVSDLAQGISTALGTTMLGLILAVPCLIAYSILRNKADRLTQEGAELSEELLISMRAGPPQPQGGMQAQGAPQPQPQQAAQQQQARVVRPVPAGVAQQAQANQAPRGTEPPQAPQSPPVPAQ